MYKSTVERAFHRGRDKVWFSPDVIVRELYEATDDRALVTVYAADPQTGAALAGRDADVYVRNITGRPIEAVVTIGRANDGHSFHVAYQRAAVYVRAVQLAEGFHAYIDRAATLGAKVDLEQIAKAISLSSGLSKDVALIDAHVLVPGQMGVS